MNPSVKKLRVGDRPKPTLSRLVRGEWNAGEGAKRKRKETSSEGVEGHVGDEETILVATESLQRTLSVIAIGTIMLDGVPSGSKRIGNGKEKVVVDLASSGGEHEASPRKRHSRGMFEELI
ncbi:hypothetical protein Fot_33326 [Forsythia ovata]|uniref:Uncharacterized protein n=1 Tax=Forsythia ovata TaxID=205694 RepID=A0ABD1TAF9_9LAMI